MNQPPTAASTPRVVCFGEILWDSTPEGMFAGGAPFNVAANLARLACAPLLVSAIGSDFMGRELIRRMESLQLSKDHIEIIPNAETGWVKVWVDKNGSPEYEIGDPVAWDSIPATETTLAAAASAAALVHGTLALRHHANAGSFSRIREALPPTAWRVYDVNLRNPMPATGFVTDLARGVDLLKVNLDEAILLASLPTPDHPERLARLLAATLGCARVCITCGSDGAGLLNGGVWFWEPTRPVVVADTIGCGDAFLAALLAGLLRGSSPAEALSAAADRAATVAASKGAIPAGD